VLKLETKTKLSPEDVVKRAVEFFTSRYGLKVLEKDSACVSFEGGEGGVEITTSSQKKVTTVEVASNGWDEEIKEFIKKL
jgi:hypothetical protein